MSAGGGTSQNSEKAGATASLLRFIAIGTITGLGFGLVMAIVSNGFVLGVKALSSLREGSYLICCELATFLFPLPQSSAYLSLLLPF